MSKLIPTPIVDKNGRQTTVHKRSSAKLSSAALSAAQPVLPSSTGTTVTHVIKGKPLHPQSIALKLFSHDEPQQYRLTSSKDEFEWRKGVEVSDDELYDYLRLGIDIQDAATLHGLGVSTQELTENPDMKDHLPGRLRRLDAKDSYREVGNLHQRVIDRFQAAGIPAMETEKALENRIKDSYLDKALNEHQLVKLFSKKRLSTFDSFTSRASDNTVHAFINGWLPMSVVDIPTTRLKAITTELVSIDNAKLDDIRSDASLYEQIIRKVSQADGFGIRDLHNLYRKFGPEVMELNDPFLCTIKVQTDGKDELETGGIEVGRYHDQFQQVLTNNGIKFGDSAKYDWWGGIRINQGQRIDNRELETLRTNGITPEEAYDGMFVHGLTADQIVVSKQDDVPQGLLGGAL